MKTFAALVVVTLAIFLLIGLNAPAEPFAPSKVTLRAAPGNRDVQMFERVGLGDEGITTMFHDKTTCTKLDGPISANFGDGTILYFHKLDCHGTIGYVNTKWVND